MEEEREHFYKRVTELLGAEGVVLDESSLYDVVQNTLGVSRTVTGISYPSNLEDVRAIVKLAQEYRVPLYPISRGKNIGYGEKAPVQNGCCLLSLERMRAIRDFDPVAGEVTIEPGVSQLDLYRFLQEQGDTYFADMTGAPADASIVGNILEGGFGHTPYGEHRKYIADIEVVLGTGDVLHAGDFPNLGPNLASLFVQSNFGVVTALRLPLLLVSEHVEMYVISFSSSEKFFASIEPLRRLRQQGVIQGSLHIANAMRSFISTQLFPKDLDAEYVMTEEDCVERMKNPFVEVGRWTAMGALYGSPYLVREYKRALRDSLPRGVHVRFFTQKKITLLMRLLRLAFIFPANLKTKLIGSLSALEHLFGLTLGIPTDEPTKNIFWRSKDFRDLGMIWHSPVIRATESEVKRLLETAEPVFDAYRFEMPLTFTMIDHEHFICVFNINFDKSNTDALERAHQAHAAFSVALKKAGIGLYRLGALDSDVFSIPDERKSVLLAFKKALDPMNIISPGRYGLDLHKHE